MISPLRWRGGTAAEDNREHLERLTDAVAVGEIHHLDALSPLSCAKKAPREAGLGLMQSIRRIWGFGGVPQQSFSGIFVIDFSRKYLL